LIGQSRTEPRGVDGVHNVDAWRKLAGVRSLASRATRRASATPCIIMSAWFRVALRYWSRVIFSESRQPPRISSRRAFSDHAPSLRDTVLEGFFLGVASTLCLARIAALGLLGRTTLQSIDSWEKRLRAPRGPRRWLTRDRG